MNIEEQIKIVKNMLLHAETQLLDYEALAIETLLTAYEKEKETSHYNQSQLDIANAKLIEEKEKNKEHKEKIIYWLDRLDLEEALQDEYDELDGCQAVAKILKQLLKEE